MQTKQPAMKKTHLYSNFLLFQQLGIVFNISLLLEMLFFLCARDSWNTFKINLKNILKPLLYRILQTTFGKNLTWIIKVWKKSTLFFSTIFIFKQIDRVNFAVRGPTLWMCGQYQCDQVSYEFMVNWMSQYRESVEVFFVIFKIMHYEKPILNRNRFHWNNLSLGL